MIGRLALAAAGGTLLFVPPAVAMSPPTTGSSITDQLVTPMLPDTFALHSRPASPRTIYLDFTGYDRDGLPGFDAGELATVQAAWMQVREDFAPFDVDVTTEDPGRDALVFSGAGDIEYGVRVVIGPRTRGQPHKGGVGTLNSFGTGRPAFVFTRPTSKTVAKSIADCASHEVGHTLGLQHDGLTSGSEYYLGHGNWAPLMGAGYFMGVTQWSKGEYAGANNPEDDLATIASWLGYAPDDYPSSSGATLTGRPLFGVIGRTGDIDAFRFRLGHEHVVHLAAWNNTGPVDANLNLRLRVYDDRGHLVVAASPDDQLTAELTAGFDAGTYTVLVDGVGEGDPASSGFSEYGSLGFYGISAMVP